MPPRKRETTTDSQIKDAKEVLADEGKAPADEAQATTPPPAEPPADPVPDAGTLHAASMAGLNGDLKELKGYVEAVVQAQNIQADRIEEAESAWANLTDSINRTTVYMNDRVSRLEMTPEPSPPVPAIYAAVWAVMNDVQGIGKHGQMEYGERYRYRKYDDLKRELGAACRAHGIMLQSDVVSVTNQHPFEKDPRKARVQVHMRYLFTSLQDGSTVRFEAVGESIDTSDKATGKAQTMALKTALDQAFMLAMEDVEDPDAVRPNDDPDDAPREARQERRDATQARREPHPTPADVAHAQRVQREYAVGDTVTVAGQTFTKHSDGPGFPNDRPKEDGNPWDQGPPPDTRTDEQKAQAAADKVSASTVTMADWSKISDAARQMGLYDVVVKVNGQEMALKHHLVAVGRTLA